MRWRMARARVGRLATASATGVPHVVPVCFALLGDELVTAVDSATYGDSRSSVAIASTTGVAAEYARTDVYAYVAAIARTGDDTQTGLGLTQARAFDDLDLDAAAHEAAIRAARLLGARKPATARVPVVFDPQMAAGFIGGLSAAVNGLLVHKKSSFLGALLGKRVAAPTVTLVDDATLAEGIATRPFDGEGVSSRKTAVVEDGILRGFLYDATTARKAKAKSTGSASRAWASLPAIGTSNFYLQRGPQKPEEIIKGVKNGLYVTAMLGRGADVVTGDYSRGANGIWIENGELTTPVQEITVSGNLLEMLQGIDAVGDDLDFRASTAAPTIRFAELVVSGA